MTIDLTDTTTGAILEALTQARRRMGGPASGMVLTLIIVTDEAEQYDAVRAASHAGREHPSRVLAVITRRPKVRVPAGRRDPGGRDRPRARPSCSACTARSASTPTRWSRRCSRRTFPWSPGGRTTHRPRRARIPLGAVAQRRVTDAAASDAPRDMLLTLAKAYQPGDTDLSWTRSTPWRTLLAATLDQPYPELLSGEVLAEPANPTADLIAAWLGLRLGIEVQRGESGGPGVTEVSFDTPDGEVTISRPDGRTATLSWPGRPERRVALHRRDTDDLIAEELRRLEPDEVYAETLPRPGREGASASERARGDRAPGRAARWPRRSPRGW